MEHTIAQLLGFLGYAVGITLCLQKDDSRFRFLLLCMCLIMAMHFALLSSYLSACLCLINGARTYFAGKTKSIWVMGGFIAIIWATGLSQATEPYQLLPVVTSTLATYGLYRASGIKLRLLFLSNNTGWMINNFLLGSIGGTLMEATFILMNLITIYRLKNDTNCLVLQENKNA